MTGRHGVRENLLFLTYLNEETRAFRTEPASSLNSDESSAVDELAINLHCRFPLDHDPMRNAGRKTHWGEH
jgi:hypothetical protein